MAGQHVAEVAGRHRERHRLRIGIGRGEEAFDYLRNVNSGHPGSITSIHAASASLAFEQLVLLVKQSRAGQELSRADIKNLLYLLIDVVIQFGVEDRKRCIKEIWYDPERKRRGLEVLKAVELDDKANSKASNLSGGQKQRVCIARALINNPKVIFADEPTGNLDSQTGSKIESLLFSLNKKKGITLIFVTHDPDLAKRCQREVHIKDGKIVSVTVNKAAGKRGSK